MFVDQEGVKHETYHWVWGEEGLGDSVEVCESELDACVGKSQLVYVGGSVSGADVALSGERRHGDGIFQFILRQVVCDSSVYISLDDKREILRTNRNIQSLEMQEKKNILVDNYLNLIPTTIASCEDFTRRNINFFFIYFKRIIFQSHGCCCCY